MPLPLRHALQHPLARRFHEHFLERDGLAPYLDATVYTSPLGGRLELTARRFAAVMRCPPRLPSARALAVVLVVAGCATTSDGARTAPVSDNPDDAVVKLVGLDFEPRTIQVPVGRRVVWRWTDSVVHNVVSDDFASSKALDGGAYAVTFDRAGTFPYRCTLHTGMDGTVVVTVF